MIVRLVTRGPLVVFAHPVGVREQVRQQAAAAEVMLRRCGGGLPPRVLVIGGSAGLGLAARVVATVAGSATIGVCHSQAGVAGRPGSAGWYATAAVHDLAARSGTACRTVIADAFTARAKHAVAAAVADTVGMVDLVVYSVAASRRRHPVTGVLHRSAIKTRGAPFVDKTVDPLTGVVYPVTVPHASASEVAETVAVMGGEDWALWWRALDQAGVLSPTARTVAFSYQGGQRLAPTYRGGTLGAAKDHLEATARELSTGPRRARVVVTTAHVTQSSAVIPMSALYWMLLARVLRERARYETPVDQLVRLFTEVLPADAVDPTGRLRVDDHELDADVQAEVDRRWAQVTTDNLADLGAPVAYRAELLRCAGFGVDGVDSAADVDPVCPIDGLITP